MELLKKITKFVSKYMAVIVIAVAALALFAPNSVSFIKTSYVNTLLGIVMFGMGLTLKPNDFKVVFSRPKDVVIGCIAQFTVMPLLAFCLTKVFNLPTELAIGVILVGTCPGGTSSNVMTYLSGGDVALSCRNDGSIYRPCTVLNSAAYLLLCRTEGRCQHGKHVPLHREGSHRTDRAWICHQPLL